MTSTLAFSFLVCYLPSLLLSGSVGGTRAIPQDKDPPVVMKVANLDGDHTFHSNLSAFRGQGVLVSGKATSAMEDPVLP